MIFNSLTLENFRVFEGIHHIDLTTSKDEPIVLFGGLNGAGKTSILTAIRLALFGKSSLGGVKTKKAYEDELRGFIHKSNDQQCDYSSVRLLLSYSKLGMDYEYQITRSWNGGRDGLNEEITIKENGQILSELDNIQAQSFLNDLIPLGVADLFFFDGEKIKSMADDEDGHVLVEALKKLVGIDLIDRAIHDTGVILRRNKKQDISKSERKEIDDMELRLKSIENDVEQKSLEYENNYLILKTELEVTLRKATQRLDESGGAWVKGRESLVKEQNVLESQRREIGQNINELMRGDVVFSLASTFMEKLNKQLIDDLSIIQSQEFNEQLDSKVKNIKAASSIEISKLIDQLKYNISREPKNNISSYQFHEFESTVKNSIKSKDLLKNMLHKYEALETEIDNLGLNISRAPDESQLEGLFKNVNEISLEIEKLNLHGASIKVEIESLLNEGIRITHELEKSYKGLQGNIATKSVSNTANKVIEAMTSLSDNLIQSKVSQLESEFNKVFKRLTRKDDMAYQAKIDRINFRIDLIDKNGNKINKKLISSGEKQIYALAMLEALGKTSGKNLPFIIDTPLGRLDSNHRSKLVNNFFPIIGEQVIILSTDTEVDEQFYNDLNPFVKTAYEIKYKDGNNSSTVTEGYFWNHENQESKCELSA
jgi:DNA sulfur modification protein DndD